MTQPRTPLHHQVGVIAYRETGDDVEFLLVTSRRSRRWVIPKGDIEPDLGNAESAALEAYEEGGVCGRLAPDSLGFYQYERRGRRCRVEVFLLAVQHQLSTWPEANQRQRVWVTPARAAEMVEERGLRLLLERAAAELVPASLAAQ
jgi:8-oxo-dGTP pyrophosphatase MutT (NUDIX family)